MRAAESASIPLAIGDVVRMKGQITLGEILEINDKKAVVAFSMIKSSVGLEKLERVSNNQLKKEQKIIRDLCTKKLNFKPDIDVRGMGYRSVASSNVFHRRCHSIKYFARPHSARDASRFASDHSRLFADGERRRSFWRRTCAIRGSGITVVDLM